MKPQVQQAILTAIGEGRQIRVRAYGIISSTEATIAFITEEILKHYQREDLLPPAYTAVKELALNGAKANIKTVLFNELAIGMDSNADYDRGMEIFRKNLNEEWVLDYARKSKAIDLFVDIVFDHNYDRLIVEVVNNRPISQRENERIRAKFKKAMAYDDIAQFYMEGGDGSEGAGMGIVLVTMLLKAQGIDPHLFTIRSNYVDTTVSRVELPLHGEYKTTRDKFQNGYELIID